MSDTSKLANVRTGTRIVGAGRRKKWTGPVVNPPVWRASTHLYESTAALAEGPRRNEDGRFFYGRRGAPTQWALSDALTQLEPGNAYDPSRAMGKGLLSDFGIEPRFFDPLDLAAYEEAFCDRTAAVLLEAPGSLSMEMCDVPAMASIAREKGAISVLDNTWAGPLGFPALEKGIDITLMALTKHVGGHSDVMMGSASAGPELYARMRQRAQQLGTVVSPDDAALALRGLRTLNLRLKQETDSALSIAEWLSQREEVAQVLCPMLPGAPGHELWKRDFSGGCGLFSFVFKGGTPADRNRFVDALELFGIGFSWGGFESLALPIEPSAYRSCMTWPPKPGETEDRFGVRLSIGLEDPADLIADLEQAMAAWPAA